MSIRTADHIYLAPTGVQKELIRPTDIFVLPSSALALPTSKPNPTTTTTTASKPRISHHDLPYTRSPHPLKPSACTPLFLAAFRLRGAGACIHTHSQWAVLVTLLLEKTATPDVFEIECIEQIKGIPRSGRSGSAAGNLGYFDRLRVPVIENTAREEDLTEGLEEAMGRWPDACAVLVRRHGVYVWGEDVARAKTVCESLDWLFRLAVEMRGLGLPWTYD